MLQRNPASYPVDVPAIPATVPPDGTVEWPHPISGLEPVEPPESSAPGAAEGPATGADPKPTTTTKRKAAPPADPKE